jgi:hypothetical protein
MNPRVRQLRAAEDFRLVLTFTNGEVRVFDVKPYLSFPVFRPLADPALFAAARLYLGSVAWPGGQDLCPDTLYEESLPMPPRGPSSGKATASNRRPRKAPRSPSC